MMPNGPSSSFDYGKVVGSPTGICRALRCGVGSLLAGISFLAKKGRHSSRERILFLLGGGKGREEQSGVFLSQPFN
jgi:hypothetical protein